jgi:hypothetical protein
VCPHTAFTVALGAVLALGGAACSGGAPVADGAPDVTLPALPPKADDAPRTFGAVRPLRTFVIALTGEVRGEVEPCGCPTTPYGGFARRARYLEELRSDGVPTFVVDAGEMLVKGLRAEADGPRRARAASVLELARATGMDAWAASPVDLLPGGVALLRGTGALSANWRDVAGAETLPASRVVERGGVRVGFVGISAPSADTTDVDAAEAVRAAMALEPADAWIVLSNAPAPLAEAVAERVPGVAAVLSTRGAQHDPPRVVGGVPLVETPDRGRYLTVLHVATATDAGAAWQIEDAGPWRALAEARQRARAQPNDAARAAARSRVTELTAEVETATAGRAVVYVQDRPLGSDLDGPSAVDAALEGFRDRTGAAARARAAERPERSGYGSAAWCARCHEDRMAAWAYDPHAKAWDALVTRQATDDAECVQCHSTGYGQPGGFAELTASNLRTFKAVQCEACHGPLAAHPDGKVEPGAVGPDACVGCHDAANSPQFDYVSYVKRTSCARLSTMQADTKSGAGTQPLPVGHPNAP